MPFVMYPMRDVVDVDVGASNESLLQATPSIESAFNVDKIEETPVLGRKITTLPLLESSVRPARGTGDLFLNNTLFVINGGGRRQTTYSVDDSTGDDSWGRQTLFTAIPFATVEEMDVVSNPISAEYGRTSGSAVNIVTKSGTNNYHGDFVGAWRPAQLGANAPLARRHTGDKLAQGSGAFSGPLVKNRTYFLLADEYTAQNRDAVITSPLDPGDVFTGDFHQHLFLGRIDHNFSENERGFLRANFDRFTDTNPADAVSGLSLPSTARNFSRKTYALDGGLTSVLSPTLVNDVRLQFQLGSPITGFQPVALSTQFVRAGVGTEGESRFASLLNHQYEAADTVNMVRGRHNIKFGADLIASSSGGFGQEFGSGFLLGQFTVKPGVTKPLSQLTINDVSRFQQSFGDSQYNVKEVIGALFAQDTITVTPRLNLDLGLRYEAESFTDDYNNLAPRVGFAYKLPHTSAAVLHGSYGVYYSEVRANLAAGYKLGGPQGIFSFSAAPGQFGFPRSLAPLPAFPAGAVLPARDITVRPGQAAFLSQFFDVSRLRFYPDALLNPYTQQYTFGTEFELGSGWTMRADYVGQHSLKIERPVDLNAPAPFIRTAPGQVRSAAVADATRPIVPVPNGYRRIITTVNSGASNYNGLQLDMQKRMSSRLTALFSYTYSHTINSVETDAPQQDPNDNNFLGDAEKATSLLDQRHRLSASLAYRLPWNITTGGWVTAAAGRPFNVTTGVDNNGDGSTSDRPVINGVVAPRNFGQGTPAYDVSSFVEKTFKINERLQTSVRAEGFNLTNANNVVGRNGVFGNAALPVASFGTSLAGINNVDPSRQFQFQLRVKF